MARDKLITIRIEGEKRQAFGDLAKSQNTDTASLLYDFISGCLDGRIDISLVTGKKQWIDKIDNQIGSDRLDKLETATQEIDNRLGKLSKKLNDWIEAFDDRLNDCDQGLSEKINNLEHRLSTLAIQLDSQQLDRIDTDSQQIDDMEPTGETSPLPPDKLGEGGKPHTPDSPPSPPVRPAIETLTTIEIVEPISTIELDKGAIESLPRDTSPDEADQPAIKTLTEEVPPSPPSPVKEAIEHSEKKIMEPVGGSDSLDTLPVPLITDKTIDQNAIATVPKTHTAIATRLGLKNPSNLSNWIKSGIPKPYQDRIKVVERNGKKKIEWIT